MKFKVIKQWGSLIKELIAEFTGGLIHQKQWSKVNYSAIHRKILLSWQKHAGHVAKQRNAALHPHNLYKEPEQTVQMGMRCQDGLSDPGITAWEVPKECAPSGADPGSLSLESTDKSNKDMLTDHYYSQVKVMLFCAYLWGREISLSLGAVVWKSDTCRWPESMVELCFWNQSLQDSELWQNSPWSRSLFKCSCPGPALCRIPSPGAQVSQMCRTPS